jgi:hypothetical protein
MDGTAGEYCAFEAASLLGIVSPELATMFGWIQSETQYGPRDGWDAPKRCAFFLKRQDGDDSPPPAPPDPAQLVLLADPTEDAAMIRATTVTV